METGETIVVSDQWAAYSTIKGMPEGYQHETANHSLHFIDPETGAYTNSIESLWQKFIMRHNSGYGTERALLNSYMDEFIWKKMCGGNVSYQLWSQIAEHYPPPSGSVKKCRIIFRLLIGLTYDSPLFGKPLV